MRRIRTLSTNFVIPTSVLYSGMWRVQPVIRVALGRIFINDGIYFGADAVRQKFVEVVIIIRNGLVAPDQTSPFFSILSPGNPSKFRLSPTSTDDQCRFQKIEFLLYVQIRHPVQVDFFGNAHLIDELHSWNQVTPACCRQCEIITFIAWREEDIWECPSTSMGSHDMKLIHHRRQARNQIECSSKLIFAPEISAFWYKLFKYAETPSSSKYPFKPVCCSPVTYSFSFVGLFIETFIPCRNRERYFSVEDCCIEHFNNELNFRKGVVVPRIHPRHYWYPTGAFCRLHP